MGEKLPKYEDKVIPISSVSPHSLGIKEERISALESDENIGGKNMNNDDMLKMYISKVDQDRVELKNDLRESEKRTEAHIADSEQRTEDRIKRIENLIIQQNNQIEKLGDKLTAELDGNKKFMLGIAVSIFLAVAAMLWALIFKL